MMRGFWLAVAIFLVAGCASTTPSEPVSETKPPSASLQYQVIYALNSKDFLYAGQHYDEASLASAMSAVTADGAVHVFVLRDAGKGLTLGELLAMLPAKGASAGNRCLFFQDSGGKTNSVVPKGSDGRLVDQSFCPKVDDLAAGVGPYAPPP